jgi:hypothetical protein
MPSTPPSRAGPSGASPGIRGARKVRASSSSGGRRAPVVQQRLDVLSHLRARALDLGQVGGRRAHVELALHRVRPLVQPGRVVQRRAEHRRDRHRRIRPGDRRDEVVAVGVLVIRPPVVRGARPRHFHSVEASPSAVRRMYFIRH